MIEIFFKTIRDPEFKQIDEYRTGSWIHVENADIDDLNEIMKLTQLEFEDLRDSLDKYELPRIESQKESVLIFARHPGGEEAGLHTHTLTMILTNTYFITISPQKNHIIDEMLKSRPPLGTTQKSKLLFHVLLSITQSFTSNIKRVRHSVLQQEQEIKRIDNSAIVALTKYEEILNQYLTSLVPMRNLLEALSSGRYVNLYEKDFNLVQDLMIAIKQSEDLCRVNIKSIRSLRDSYQIIFTNDVNRTIKRLTAITIIFMIPTIIASVYGMNISLPLEKSPWAFFIIMNTTVIITLVSVVLFAKKKWL